MKTLVAGFLATALVLTLIGSRDESPAARYPEEDVALSRVGSTGFTHILDLLPSDTGVWVLSKDEAFLTHLPSGGGTPNAMGRLGDGPTELRTPLSLIDAGVNVQVIDPVAGRALIVRPTLRMEPAPWDARQPAMVRSILGILAPQSPFRTLEADGALIAATFESPVRFPVEQSLGELVRLDHRGRRLSGSSEPISPDPPQLPPFLSPLPLWDACASGVLHFDGESALTWMLSDGRRLHRTLDLPRPRLDETFVHEYFAEWARVEAPGVDAAAVREAATRAALQRPRLTPAAGPAVIGLACVVDHALLNLFDPAAPPHGRGSRWLIVPPAGQVRAATIIAGFRPLRSRGHLLYGAVRDPTTGFDYVATVAFDLTNPFPPILE